MVAHLTVIQEGGVGCQTSHQNQRIQGPVCWTCHHGQVQRNYPQQQWVQPQERLQRPQGNAAVESAIAVQKWLSKDQHVCWFRGDNTSGGRMERGWKLPNDRFTSTCCSCKWGRAESTWSNPGDHHLGRIQCCPLSTDTRWYCHHHWWNIVCLKDLLVFLWCRLWATYWFSWTANADILTWSSFAYSINMYTIDTTPMQI